MYSEESNFLTVGSCDTTLKYYPEDQSMARSYCPHLAPIWVGLSVCFLTYLTHMHQSHSITEYLSAVATCSDDGTVCTNILGTGKKRKETHKSSNLVLAKLTKKDDQLSLTFPLETAVIHKNALASVNTFYDRIVGWRHVEWCPNKTSCNWLACGSNMGIVCLIPYRSPVPRQFFRRPG